MKKNIVFAFLFFTTITKAQIPTITLEVISKFEGKVVTICEEVTGTYASKKNTVFLNFGKPFPKNEFTIVLFSGAIESFSYNPKEFLKNKVICARGKIVQYKGKYEMIVSKQEDIKIQ